tara:strand:+ start:53885 stop:54367 length:483 start_codon:yes stop_codon:yes gene_type:complete
MNEDSPQSIELKKIEVVLNHIKNVQKNCEILGKKLIENGEFLLGRTLIANGLTHDNSKFYGIEWDYLLSKEKDKLSLAISHHISTNFHHPESLGDTSSMSRVYIAEFVCDTFARSQEMGTSYSDWLKEEATKKWGFTTNSKFYKECKVFYDLLALKFEKL